MSRRRQPLARELAVRQAQAAIFAALGDPTRLGLLNELSTGRARSITELTADGRITRQAITKHLRVMESAGLVEASRLGREVRFRFVPETVREASQYLTEVAQLWDQALGRLKSFVESDTGIGPTT